MSSGMKGKIVYARDGSRRYFVGEREVSQAEFDNTFPSKGKIEDLLEAATFLPAHTTTCWPMASEGLAVHPDQIPEAMARDKRHGVPTRYTRDGRPIFTDRGHRRDYLKLEASHDRNGGYGD